MKLSNDAKSQIDNLAAWVIILDIVKWVKETELLKTVRSISDQTHNNCKAILATTPEWSFYSSAIFRLCHTNWISVIPYNVWLTSPELKTLAAHHSDVDFVTRLDLWDVFKTKDSIRKRISILLENSWVDWIFWEQKQQICYSEAAPKVFMKKEDFIRTSWFKNVIMEDLHFVEDQLNKNAVIRYRDALTGESAPWKFEVLFNYIFKGWNK